MGEQEAIEMLGEIGQNTSLRYVVQLMTPAAVLAKTNGRETVTREDIEEIDQLFYDAKSSANLFSYSRAEANPPNLTRPTFRSIDRFFDFLSEKKHSDRNSLPRGVVPRPKRRGESGPGPGLGSV